MRFDAAVEQSRDMRMDQTSEDLALLAEAPDHLVRVHATLDHLDRDAMPGDAVNAFGAIDSAHAAATELVDQAIGADAFTDRGVDLVRQCKRGDAERRIEHFIAALIRAKQHARRIEQSRIARALVGEPRFAVHGRFV